MCGEVHFRALLAGVHHTYTHVKMHCSVRISYSAFVVYFRIKDLIITIQTINRDFHKRLYKSYSIIVSNVHAYFWFTSCYTCLFAVFTVCMKSAYVLNLSRSRESKPWTWKWGSCMRCVSLGTFYLYFKFSLPWCQNVRPAAAILIHCTIVPTLCVISYCVDAHKEHVECQDAGCLGIRIQCQYSLYKGRFVVHLNSSTWMQMLHCSTDVLHRDAVKINTLLAQYFC